MQDEKMINNEMLTMKIQHLASKNIQYPLSSEDTSGSYESETPPIHQTIYQKLQNGQALTGEEKEFLQKNDHVAYEKANSIEHEAQKLLQKLQDCQTKQEAAQVEAFHLDMIHAWCTLAENNTAISTEQKIGYTLFKEAIVSAITNTFRTFTESDLYQDLPADTEQTQISPKDDAARINDLCHVKAQKKYHDLSSIPDTGTPSSFNAKG